MFSARFLDAEEALRIGLVNFVEPRETIEGPSPNTRAMWPATRR